jgi:hypothetical protein
MSAQFRAKFEEKLQTLMSEKDTSSFLLTKEKYLWIIDRLDLLTTTVIKKKSKDYRLLNRYEVVIMPGTGEKKLQKRNTTFLYVSDEDLFDVIYAIHVATGHGARDVMNARVKKKYANVTKEVLQLFADMCDECQAKKGKKMPLRKPISAQTVASRCQVDVVDVQMNPYEHYHYIMSYQDQRTKYVCLRALQTADAKEVTEQLVDIFCVFGAPCILQSYNGREFARKIIREVRSVWPKCVLVYGKASEKRILDKDIVSILNQWMKENQTNKWVDGLRYVQWEKNNTEDPDINKTPHSAMFNSDSILGLHSSNLPNDVIEVLEREEDLAEVVNGEAQVKVEEVELDENQPLDKPQVHQVQAITPEDGHNTQHPRSPQHSQVAHSRPHSPTHPRSQPHSPQHPQLPRSHPHSPHPRSPRPTPHGTDTPQMNVKSPPAKVPQPCETDTDAPTDRNNSSEDDSPNSTSSSSNSDSEQGLSETGSSSDDVMKVTSHTTHVKAASRDYLPPQQHSQGNAQQNNRNFITLESVRSVWELMMERNGPISMNIGTSSGSDTGESSSTPRTQGQQLTLPQQTRETLKREFIAAAAASDVSEDAIVNAMAKRFKGVEMKSDADDK